MMKVIEHLKLNDSVEGVSYWRSVYSALYPHSGETYKGLDWVGGYVIEDINEKNKMLVGIDTKYVHAEFDFVANLHLWNPKAQHAVYALKVMTLATVALQKLGAKHAMFHCSNLDVVGFMQRLHNIPDSAVGRVGNIWVILLPLAFTGSETGLEKMWKAAKGEIKYPWKL